VRRRLVAVLGLKLLRKRVMVTRLTRAPPVFFRHFFDIMSGFQLDREWLERQRQAGREVAPLPSVFALIGRGAMGGLLLSVAGFVPWAVTGRWLYRMVGEAGLYGVCALVFIALSGPLLHRLLAGPQSLRRFYRLFAVSFTVYAAVWTAGWMAVGGHAGSVLGLLAAALAMAGTLAWAFGTPGEVPGMAAALFGPTAVGYFAGGVVEGWLMRLADGSRLGGMGAMLSWGVFFGLGFGAGLGLALFLGQRRVRGQAGG